MFDRPEPLGLERIEDRLPIHAFMIGDSSQNSIQRSDANRLVRGNCDTVRRRLLRLQNDVAPDLVYLDVSPAAAERSCEIVAAQITRNFHPSASISSRMR